MIAISVLTMPHIRNLSTVQVIIISDSYNES